jgi:hypothetical protein
MVELYLHSPNVFMEYYFNKLSTGTNLPFYGLKRQSAALSEFMMFCYFKIFSTVGGFLRDL